MICTWFFFPILSMKTSPDTIKSFLWSKELHAQSINFFKILPPDYNDGQTCLVLHYFEDINFAYCQLMEIFMQNIKLDLPTFGWLANNAETPVALLFQQQQNL